MAARADTPNHSFVWTPINNQQKQTVKSRCDQCGSRASHRVHRVQNGYQFCKNCREILVTSMEYGKWVTRHALADAQAKCSYPEVR